MISSTGRLKHFGEKPGQNRHKGIWTSKNAHLRLAPTRDVAARHLLVIGYVSFIFLFAFSPFTYQVDIFSPPPLSLPLSKVLETCAVLHFTLIV